MKFALLMLVVIPPVMATEAADVDTVDTSKWACKFCEFEEPGFSFTPDLGLGYVSDDSAKFGEYTGMNEQGTYVIADADGRYRGKDGRWLDLSVVDLGLDSRYVGVEAGVQGRYELHLAYRQIPHHISDTARTPFIGANPLTLPSGWIPGATTSAMPALDASLHAVDFDTERRQFGLGGSLTPVQHWAFSLDMRHEEKSGTRGTGGAFFFNDAQLAMPIDYQTDQFDASAAYTSERLQTRVAYYGSIFRNDDAALTWQNPYLPLAGGSTGQLGLAPDNQFHQLTVSAAYRVGPRAQFSGDLALGRMTQDQAFLPYTVNSSLPTQPLPRGSLDGRVDTLAGNLRFTSALADELRVNGTLSYDEHNNQTPQSLYDWVSTDSAMATPRANLPYSYSHANGTADAALALSAAVHIYAGCMFDNYWRDLQEVHRMVESGCWGKASLKPGDFAEMSLKYTHTERTGSEYVPDPDGTPRQNPLMRIHTMADRNRDEIKLRLDLTPGERFSLGVDGRATWDSYQSSTLGRLDGNSWSAAVDCSWMVSSKVSATCYASREQVRSRQANAELLAPSPTWRAENTDHTDSAGAGLRYSAHDKLDLGLDYTFARSTGAILVKGATEGFPDLTTRLNSAKLYADFVTRKKFSVRIAYWYEEYRSDDWALDEVLPATISNVLAFGTQSPRYSVNVVTVSCRREF